MHKLLIICAQVVPASSIPDGWDWILDLMDWIFIYINFWSFVLKSRMKDSTSVAPSFGIKSRTSLNLN